VDDAANERIVMGDVAHADFWLFDAKAVGGSLTVRMTQARHLAQAPQAISASGTGLRGSVGNIQRR